MNELLVKNMLLKQSQEPSDVHELVYEIQIGQLQVLFLLAQLELVKLN